jgi:hypothetical protein
MVLLFAVFTLSGVFVESLVFLTFAVTLEIRRMARAPDTPARDGTPTPDQEPAAAGSERPHMPVFDIRGGRGVLLLVLFASAGAGATLLAWNLSLQAAQTLASAYLVSSFFLFLSPGLLLRRRDAP